MYVGDDQRMLGAGIAHALHIIAGPRLEEQGAQVLGGAGAGGKDADFLVAAGLGVGKVIAAVGVGAGTAGEAEELVGDHVGKALALPGAVVVLRPVCAAVLLHQVDQLHFHILLLDRGGGVACRGEA